MKFIKNIFLLFLILLVLYIVWFFLSPSVKTFWDEIWLKTFNEFLGNFWKRVNQLNEIDAKKTLNNINSGINESINIVDDYAKGLKETIDKTRKTADEINKNYQEVKNQIDETTKNIQDIWNKVKETKESIDKTTKIFN